MAKHVISTDGAPRAIGTYSQAVRVDNTVYISGQIPLDPATMEPVAADIAAQTTRVFENIAAIVAAAGADMSDIVKLTIYLVDLTAFPVVNDVMARYFETPYPARATVGVNALPKGVAVEIDAVLQLPRAATRSTSD